jgi:hypothetical protein
VLDVSNVSRAYHTRHGQHLNRKVKECVGKEMSKMIGKKKSVQM